MSVFFLPGYSPGFALLLLFFFNCLLRSLFRLSLWIFWKVKMTSTKARHVFSDRSVRLNPKRLLCKKTPVTQSYSLARTRSISNYYIPQWGFVNVIFSAAFDSSFPFFPNISVSTVSSACGCHVTDLEGSHAYLHDSLSEHEGCHSWSYTQINLFR